MARLQKLLFLLVLVWLLPAGPVQAREIRVGVYQNEPKVFTDASGKPAGILIELLGEIAAREGWQLQFVNCTWAACLDQLAAGGIDLLPDVAHSDERARRFDFHPTPALYSWSQLYQRKGVNIVSPLDLQGKRLVVLAGSLQQSGLQTLLDAYGVRAEVATADTLEEAFRQVQRGQADAVATNHFYGDIRAHTFALHESPLVFQPARLHYAVGAGRHADLLAAIERHLQAWQSSTDSPYVVILKRWGVTQPVAPTPRWIAEGLAIAVLVVLALLVLVWLLRRKIRHATRAIERSRAQLQATLDTLPDMLFEVGLDGRFHDYHAAPSNQPLLPPSAFLGKTIAEIMPPEAAAVVLAELQKASEQGFARGAQYALDLPGQGRRWFELSVAAKRVGNDEAPRFLALVHDITDIRRMRQLYAALSQCNQAIVRCRDEAELFPLVCRDAVEIGGMSMAWIGMLDEQVGKVSKVAAFGAGLEYLDEIDISLDENLPSGRGPTGTALRESHPVWIQDFQRDPGTAPWHERGARFGWAASASLPLYRKGQAVGAFNLYAATANAFDTSARNLLEEMALDIGYALERFADARERLQMSDQLRQLSLAVEQSPSSIVITDLDANIVYANATFTRQTGYGAAEVIGQNPRILQSGNTPRATYDDLWAHLTRGERWEGELYNRRKDGSEYIEWARLSPVRDAQGVVRNYLAIKDDITARKQADERIRQLAHFDQLTGLPNRLLLQDHFHFALSLAQRNSQNLAVMFLDLDHFKSINDTLGHSIGDRLLIEVAQRLKATLREEDTVSRQGGDEFILILPNIDANGASKVARKLLDVVARPFSHETHEMTSTVCVGIALYPDDGDDMETLSKHADTAMYRAKDEGRNTFRFFTQAMQLDSARHLQLANELRHAIERNEFVLHYQPQIAIQDGRLVGAEALLRWHHPQLGSVSPAEFIPVAEDSGQIIQIGEWVLRTAAAQRMAWLAQGWQDGVMAVNLSAVQFRQAGLREMVAGVLRETGLPAHCLELELTEAVAMKDPQAAVAVMDALYAGGIRMSIDDFGTGYSSLSYLKRFKVYKLKIDQSFVRDVGHDPEDRAIVSAIISMAHSLGLHTIAEGVETTDQLAFLRLQGCDEVQGYYFSKPLAAQAFEESMARWLTPGSTPIQSPVGE